MYSSFVVVVVILFYFISFYDTSFPSSLLFACFLNRSFSVAHTRNAFFCFLIWCCPFSFSLVVKSFYFFCVHITNTNKEFCYFFMRTLVFFSDVYYFILFILFYMVMSNGKIEAKIFPLVYIHFSIIFSGSPVIQSGQANVLYCCCCCNSISAAAAYS